MASRSSRTGPVDPRLWQRARATRTYLAAGVAVGTATAVLIVAQAWLLADAIGDTFALVRTGDAVTTRDLTTLTAALPVLVAVIGGRALLTWLNQVLAVRASAAVKSQLRADIVEARLRRRDPVSSGVGPAVGDSASLVTVVTQGLDALDGYFARYLPQLVLAVTIPLVVGIAILSADWIAAATIALTLPLIPLFMVLVGWVTQARVARRQRVQSRLAHHFADLVAGLPTLQIFGRARAQAEGLQRSEAAHRSETMATLRISFLSSLVLELLATLSVALVAVGVGLRVVEGHLDLTVALFVLILAPEAYLPLRQVGTHYHDSADGIAAAERAFGLIDADVPTTSTTVLPRVAQSMIELDGVTVVYPGAERAAVTDVHLAVGPREIVALHGPSGGGKSTLVDVVMGFVRPTSGTLRVRGVDVEDADLDAWRRQLAWVGQQPVLLAGTIGANVALGAANAAGARIRSALRRAGAADLDPDRTVGPRGEGLSPGEIRRVAVARALLRIDLGEAQMLILDEPTAGLDADAEALMITELRGLGIGALVVSHRPAVLAAADRTVFVAPSRTSTKATVGA